MARIRSVHPDICVSPTMAELPAHLERTFVRLWTHCDDHGRCLDIPRLIKAAIYPLHDDMTAEVLDDELEQLRKAGLVIRYQGDGKALLAVRSWGEYQHPNRPRPSKLAAPKKSDERRHVHSSELAVLEHGGDTSGGESSMHAHVHASAGIADARQTLRAVN